jgi:transposase-like protein
MEGAGSWAGVFEDLVSRGLRGVRFIVSDEHAECPPVWMRNDRKLGI